MFQFGLSDNSQTMQSYPFFLLSGSNWDDFGTKSSFTLYYYRSSRDLVTIGEIKILSEDASITVLPREFPSLDSSYISLGQSLSFYENLSALFTVEECEVILNSLNDVAWQPSKSEEFESKSPYRNSLLRENEARSSLRFGRSIILGEAYDERFSFEYTADIEGADNSFSISIDFDEEDSIPGRIVGVIGRNAVGKTQLLGNLAKDLVQTQKVSQKTVDDRNKKFEGNRPIFNRVIAVSYSAFDKFSRPKDQYASYVYCGVRNDSGALSRKHLIENYKKNLLSIKELDREHVWVKAMSEILDNKSDEFLTKLNNEIEIDFSNEYDEGALSIMSSGQSILAHFVTAVIARIQEHTLILFDEPETHLHPNAVAHLFNVLDRILKRYDSFAIIATHSPIVIQEIPRKRLILLTREGNNTLNTPMEFETFGESISELTRHVFDTVSTPHYYKKVLKGLSENRSFEEVNDLFDDGLSFNAKSYLLGQYGDKG